MSGKELARVLVTGANGYIASHVVQQLLSAKDPTTGQPLYIVRGTVRDASNEQKCAPLREMAAKIGDGAEDRLELVSADLMKDDGWENAVEGCKYIEHLASLPMSTPKNPDDLVQPMVAGTERVLNAAGKNRGVKRVIMTSSVAAISGGGVPARCHKTLDHVFSEDDWSDPDSCPPYLAGKTVSERKAWELWSSLPEDERFELVCINPGVVIGPLVVKNPGVTMDLVIMGMSNGIPVYPSIYLDFVDVRDVARIHIMSLTQEGISGQRFLVCSEQSTSLTFLDSVKFLQQHYNPQGFNIKARAMPHWLIHMAKYISSDVKNMSEMLAGPCKYDLSKAISTFDFEYIQPKESFLAAAESCLEFGCVSRPAAAARGMSTATVMFAVVLAAAAAGGAWYIFEMQ